MTKLLIFPYRVHKFFSRNVIEVNHTVNIQLKRLMENVTFLQEFHVRDYECDFQGIVNNAVYMNYLEHARHEFARHQGLNVVELAQRGINLVVIRAELEYKSPLRSGDSFVIETTLEQFSRIRLAFHHAIYRKEPRHPILRAQILIAAMNERGRPFFPQELSVLFHKTSPRMFD